MALKYRINEAVAGMLTEPAAADEVVAFNDATAAHSAVLDAFTTYTILADGGDCHIRGSVDGLSAATTGWELLKDGVVRTWFSKSALAISVIGAASASGNLRITKKASLE